MESLSEPQRAILATLGRRKRGRGHVDEVCTTTGRRRTAIEKLEALGLVTVDGEKPATSSRDERVVTLTARGRRMVTNLWEDRHGGGGRAAGGGEAVPAGAGHTQTGVSADEADMLAYLAERLRDRETRPQVTLYTASGKSSGGLLKIGDDFLAIRTESGVEQVFQRRFIVHVDFSWREDGSRP